jgi:hypothetical protein
LASYDVKVNNDALILEKTEFPFKNHSLVLTARNPENRDMAVLFIDSELPEALPGLGRKLPHYHKYSYLIFEGTEPENKAKGRWPVTDSRMAFFIPLEDGSIPRVLMAKLVPRKPLAVLQPVFSPENMQETVTYLAGEKLRGRGLGTAELDEAAAFIAGKFREAGLKPAGDADSYFQSWEEQKGSEHEQVLILKNVVGVIPGTNPALADQSIVIGAHYDHLGIGSSAGSKEHLGQIHYGADDNASGVAVLIELARVLGRNLRPERSVVFVAFTGEEAGRKGSGYYAKNQKTFPPGKCLGMVNLDTVGRLVKNKLFVLGAGSAREWGHIFRGAGHAAGVEIKAVSEELDSSDQKSFQEAGIPAVQLFTGPHADYHRPADTADKINFEGLVKVAAVAKEAIEYLAKEEKPLTQSVQSEKTAGAEPKQERKVSLGIMPDFSFQEEGCRLSGVVPGSAAEKAGLREGDIIIRINSAEVKKLRDLSDILKSLHPGDRVSVTCLRDGQETTVEGIVTDK